MQLIRVNAAYITIPALAVMFEQQFIGKLNGTNGALASRHGRSANAGAGQLAGKSARLRLCRFDPDGKTSPLMDSPFSPSAASI
jgi:hypothetical protein